MLQRYTKLQFTANVTQSPRREINISFFEFLRRGGSPSGSDPLRVEQSLIATAKKFEQNKYYLPESLLS